MQHWSTDVAPSTESLAYWIDAICEGFLEMSVTSPSPSAFSASLLSTPLGCLQVNQVNASAQDVYRDERCLAKSDKACFYLLHQQDSPWLTEQAGQRARMKPGDLVLVDARRCYYLGFPTAVNTLSLELPASWLETWLPHAQNVLSQAIDGQSGWGKALASYVSQWSPQWAESCTLPTELLTDHLGVLLNLSLQAGGAASVTGTHTESRLAVRVLQYLAQHFANPDLCAQLVSQQLGASPRSVHRAMASQGKTFGQCLLTIRLEHAKRMLQDQHFKQFSIAEIGRRVGYLDASQFSRVIKRLAGQTPLHMRQSRTRQTPLVAAIA